MSTYEDFVQSLQDNFETTTHKRPIFQTGFEDLFEIFLKNIPLSERQYHTCRTCQAFFKNYGGLVVVDPNTGELEPAFWSNTLAPKELKRAVRAVIAAVKQRTITTVFVSSDVEYGHSITNNKQTWTHLAIRPPYSQIYRGRVKTAFEVSAEKHQDYLTVWTALREYPANVVDTAVLILQSEALYRSEKVLGPAKWLLDLHLSMTTVSSKNIDNMVWLAVAQAPAGFCHPRSSMIGTLLDDLKSGLDLDSVKRRFNDKMNPLQYQRPQAAPSVGNIDSAAQAIAKLGVERSFERRYATLDDVQKLWVPTPQLAPASQHMFSGLKPKESTFSNSSIIDITWGKFERTVLHSADKLRIKVPLTPQPFATYVTAFHEDAPPILQWDGDEVRNPVSWYLYEGGTSPSQVNLGMGYQEVVAVTLQPNMWYGGFEHQGAGVLFVIKNARDQRTPSLGLFPEILRSELHPYRSTIEAYCRTKAIRNPPGYISRLPQQVTGLMLQKGGSMQYTVEVTYNSVTQTYKIDRWD